MTGRALTPAHCRAARGLLDWTMKHLATRSDIASSRLRDFERNRPSLSPAALEQLQATFEGAGIEFLIGDDQGSTVIGVCYRGE